MFDVYVVGSNEPGDEGLDKLAEAMSTRYGLPLDDLRSRLARGRFRVKANVDRATSDAYAKDLHLIGGRCSVEDAAQVDGPSAPTAVPPLPRTSTPPAGIYQSGLSAAFSDTSIPVAELGALGGGADQYSLSSLDGHDGHAGAKMPPTGSFGPPAATAKPSGPAKAPRPRDVPVELETTLDGAGPGIPLAPADPADRFRPPDADDDDRPVELAVDELEHRARKRVPTPPATEAVAPPPPAQGRTSTRPLSPAARAAGEPVAVMRRPSRLGVLGDDGHRFAAGVLLAIVLGFVPAHLISSSRERSAYAAIDAAVDVQQAKPDEYDSLDAFRARKLDDKRGAKHDAMILAFALWGLVGGGIAYGWFRRVPWDRLDS